MAYITGRKEFWTFVLDVNSSVLIPRPDTEIIVEEALNLCRKMDSSEIKILDIGTGSGAIAIALASEITGAKVVATDISPPALNLAQKAKEQVPEEAHISDTLGWIYYKKNVPGTAITYQKEAADKMPDQPVVRYHLGMAYYKNGNRDLAKKELSAALKINSGFAGADEARATLNNIK